jgi:glycosyltransferase involved in cell wall biosynthesis
VRVLHVAGDTLSSGAGRGAYWLHRGLVARGVDSRFLVTDICPEDPTVTPFGSPDGMARQRTWRRRIDKAPLVFYPRRRSQIFSTAWTGADLTTHEEYRRADVINLHWVNGGLLSIASIGRIRKPVVWTLRDMWPFTGGCHYALDCARYETGCGRCPHLGSECERDLSARIVRRKRRALPPMMAAVGISRWIAECARRSVVFEGKRVEAILNCIDTQAFRPMDKAEAKRSLGVDPDRPMVLAGATAVTEFYKGADLYRVALERVATVGWTFAEFGRPSSDENWPVPVRRFGYQTDSDALRTIYAAADVFVLPSRQDAFAKTGAEALACGTPVACFDSAGPRDIVDHLQTGWKARPFDPDDLAAGLRWILETEDRRRMLCDAAARAAHRFSPDVAAGQYEDLYRSLLDPVA